MATIDPRSAPGHAQVRRSSGVLFADLGEETIFMSGDQASYISLDDIGSDVWKRIYPTITIDALVQQLVKDYEGDPATIEHDVRDLLSELAANGLIELS